MWNYIYYYVYLNTIDKTDHTAIQQYVYEVSDIIDVLSSKAILIHSFLQSFNMSKAEFFPHEEAVHIPHCDKDDGIKIEQLQQRLEWIHNRLEEKVDIVAFYKSKTMRACV